jgi:hypothetical protein
MGAGSKYHCTSKASTFVPAEVVLHMGAGSTYYCTSKASTIVPAKLALLYQALDLPCRVPGCAFRDATAECCSFAGFPTCSAFCVSCCTFVLVKQVN